MKKAVILIMLILLSLSLVSAVDILTSPYSDTFTTESELSKTVAQIRQEEGIKSCYDDINWENKNCDYVYFCYAILPSYSDDIGDALLRECEDVTTKTSITLSVKDFIPPKGVLYYVTTFVTITNYQYDDITKDWKTPITRIPTQYINAHAIRSVCPSGQMLGMERDIGGIPIKPKCYIAERVCIDPLSTGLCTNPYELYVLDRDENGKWEDNIGDASNYCKDANKDSICDFTVDLECTDVCRNFKLNEATGQLVCEVSGMNGLCDEWDMAAEWSCIDKVLSPNSNICDDVDIYGCFRDYDPVCVGGRGGTTYPNACFAEGQGHKDYIAGACEPSVVQCYVPEDCPDTNVCLGGSTTAITKICLDYMCTYSGSCGNLACDKDTDCDGMEMPCVGVFPKCENKRCVVNGKCLTKPEPQKLNLWELIQSVWNGFWAFINSLLGG